MVDKIKKILSYIVLPVTLLVGWLVGRFFGSKVNVGYGASGKADAELSEAGRDLDRATEDLGRAEESASSLAESISDSADKADRLGDLDDEYQRLHRENSELIDELFSRVRKRAEESEDSDIDTCSTPDHLVRDDSDTNTYIMEDW